MENNKIFKAGSSKILIIEDNPYIADMYIKAFRKHHFLVEYSEQGMDGVVKTLEFQPDIILLDLKMPQMDGFEFIHAIKNNSNLPVKIVVCSNLNTAESIEKALAQGADAFLPKIEYPPEKAVEKIKALLSA